MNTDRFHELLGVPGPFASVYFDDTHDTGDSPARLEAQWPSLRAELVAQGADESLTTAVEHAVMELRLPIGGGGRAVVAGPPGVILNEFLLASAPRPVVRVSGLPYLIPILEHGGEHSRYLVVVADPTGPFIIKHRNSIRSPETVKANGFRAELDLRAIADRVGELVDKKSFSIVFLVGDAKSSAGLLAALPPKVRARATSLPISARRGGYDFEQIQRAIDTIMVRQRVSVMDSAAGRFTSELGRRSGLAAEGLAAVCAALRQGAVDTMIIGDIDDATIVTDAGLTIAAPTADLLPQQNGGSAKTRRADEALPMLAIAAGASIVRTDERITPADGVAAVLRHPVTQEQSTPPPAVAGLRRR